jgi:hypothetical protein
MGEANSPTAVLLLLAAFSRYCEALAWARQRACETWGPVALESPVFEFTHTDYYQAAMGPGLRKVFFALARLIDPGELAEIKRLTNAWEGEYAAVAGRPEPRPLNLDPGYLTPGKLVLASTKDHAHRIYLGRGIYAEVTLYYKHHAWRSSEWTFADYRQETYHCFFSTCREYLRRRLREDQTS